MTRTRSANVIGMAPPDGDVDAPTWTGRFLQIVQDANLVYDKMTGENGISAISTCIHNGEYGRGAPLRRHKAGQIVNRTRENGLAVAEADHDTYGGEVCIVAVPIRIPQGELAHVVEIDVPGAPNVRFRTFDSSMAVVQDFTVGDGETSNEESALRSVVLQFAAPGRYYLLISLDTRDTTAMAFRSWQMLPTSSAASASQSTVDGDTTNPFPVGTAVGEVFETIHDEMIADNYPIASWIVTALSRNINWLIESATGFWPRGNASLQLADSGTTNPATVAFWAHTRAVWPSEPEVELGVFVEALGSCRATVIDSSDLCETVDSALTRGMINWSPLIPNYGGTTRRTGFRRVCYLPDFPSSPSRLKACVLMANSNGKGTPTAWDARVTTGAGSSAAASFVRVGTSDLYAAEITAIPFLPDQINVIDFEFARAAGATTFGEIMIVGVELDFDP